MGSDNFGGCAGGVRTKALPEEAEVRKLEGASAGIKRPFDKWNSAASRKGEICAVYSSVASWNNVTEDEVCRDVDEQSVIWSKETSEGLNSSTNVAKTAKLNARSQLKPRKAGRNASGSSKGLKMLEVDGSVSKTGEDDARAIETLSNHASCNNEEKVQMPKLRNNSTGKRGDKRLGKTSRGNLSLKNGMISFSSAAGGHNFLGSYGLKSDTLDVAEKMEDMSLEELLDGSYMSPLFTKYKEKKATSSNESLLHAIRNACSLLQKPERVKSCSDDDKIAEPMHIASFSATEADGIKADACTSAVSSYDKEACGKLKTAEACVNLPPCKHVDILKHISLPPTKDLDALLLDATKHTSSRNNPDPRLGKPTSSQRIGLPPFPWSHGYSGNHKSGPDASKPSTSRTACQGKWVRVNDIFTPQDGCPSFAVDLQSLTYDHSLVPSGSKPSVIPERGNQIQHPCDTQNGEPLESQTQSHVPSGGQTSDLSEKGNTPAVQAEFASFDRVLSSFATCSISQVSSEEPSPRCLTAARTLCEIATRSVKRRTNGTVKCLKKPTQKSTRAPPKLKLSEKPEKPFAAPNSMDMMRACEGMLPPKRPKLMLDGERNGKATARNFDRKHWSAPRSVRPSSSKYCKNATSSETKGHSNSSFVDKLYMMKGCSSQQKAFK
ncbi:unnamed protein product [Cuscuta epithymum]|uniref:Uncharacterized protein n=1 Tax=Cuscuta epithymum TaxID=186058 RepID=A0AAV0EL78_9ASTE|nr:unnamed protein product [Cuscuta epithymum]CAH9124817.1 unnamed protein product [Cuscuta epithymum]